MWLWFHQQFHRILDLREFSGPKKLELFFFRLVGSPHTEIFQIEENHRLRKKIRSLHPREQKKLVGVFTFFNGALEKKLEWCDQKNRIRSADGSI